MNKLPEIKCSVQLLFLFVILQFVVSFHLEPINVIESDQEVVARHVNGVPNRAQHKRQFDELNPFDEDDNDEDDPTAGLFSINRTNPISFFANLVKKITRAPSVNLTRYVDIATSILPQPVGTHLKGVYKTVIGNNPLLNRWSQTTLEPPTTEKRRRTTTADPDNEEEDATTKRAAPVLPEIPTEETDESTTINPESQSESVDVTQAGEVVSESPNNATTDSNIEKNIGEVVSETIISTTEEIITEPTTTGTTISFDAFVPISNVTKKKKIKTTTESIGDEEAPFEKEESYYLKPFGS